jgi:hypothetical protein
LPGGRLVEELKVNKNVFKDFTKILKTYVDGECPYDSETNDEDGGIEESA